MKIIITETQLKLITESISDDEEFLDYIKDVEGKVIDSKTGLHKAYKDAVGVVTIGYGHSENRDPNIKLGMKIPETKAISYLKNDLKTDETAVKSYVAKNFPGYTLDNNQLKMLIDFNYNPGLGEFPKFVKAVVTKDWATAKKEYKRYAGGKELTDRNQKFYNLFLSNKTVANPVAKPSKPKETIGDGSEFKTIGKTLYPRKTSKHDYANVRTEPEINNGWFDNIIETIKWPNPVGVALNKKIDDQGYTWYYVKLPEGTSLFNTNGWVRFDAITINKDEKYK
jgi:GH24 family phage-related lysozyme (muramidase)